MARSPMLLLCAALWAFTARASTEVVLAHYQEDLAWVDAYARSDVRFRVYSKAEDQMYVPETAERLPNVGREAHTYLHHIVQHYDDLEDWTVFSQAGEPSHGYLGAGNGGGHLTGLVRFEDYLTQPASQQSLFFFTSAVQLPSLDHSLRVDYALQGTEVASSTICPPALEEGWTKFFAMKRLQEWLLRRQEESQGPPALAFYEDFVAGKAVGKDSLVLTFAQGARFGASRAQIRSRPRAYYERLLAQLSAEKDPLVGYWLEYMWYDVLHPEELQSRDGTPCEVPAYAPVTQWQMIEALSARTAIINLDRRRLQSSGPSDGDGAMPTGEPTASPVAPVPAPTRSPTRADQDLVVSISSELRFISLNIQNTRSDIADMELVLGNTVKRTLGLAKSAGKATGKLVFTGAGSRRRGLVGLLRVLQSDNAQWRYSSKVEVNFAEAKEANLVTGSEADAQGALAQAGAALKTTLQSAVSDGTTFSANLDTVFEETVLEKVAAGDASFAGLDLTDDVDTQLAQARTQLSTSTTVSVSDPSVAQNESGDEDDDEIAGLPAPTFFVVTILVPIVGVAVIAGVGYLVHQRTADSAPNFSNIQSL